MKTNLIEIINELEDQSYNLAGHIKVINFDDAIEPIFRLEAELREEIKQVEEENNRNLEGINEDRLRNPSEEAIIRGSYFNNGIIYALKEILGDS